MNRLSLEKELSEVIETTLKEWRKILDEDFERFENYAKFCMEQSSRLSKISDDINKIFKFRLPSSFLYPVVVKDDLELLSSFVAMQSRIQSDLAVISYRNIREMKEVSYHLVGIPLHIAVRILSMLAEVIPKASLEARKILEERLETLEIEIQKLKKRKEIIKLEAREDIIRTIEDIQKMLERAKKAQEQYVK